MLNFSRYTNIYWFVHQWNSETLPLVHFKTYYNLLNNKNWIRGNKPQTIDNSIKIPNNLTNRNVLIQDFQNILPNRIPNMVFYKIPVILLKTKTTSLVTGVNKNKILLPKDYSIKFQFDVKQKSEDFYHKAWVIGYKKISFYTKKTITYEKNRKVKKSKLFIKFTKMYNFLKNIINVMFRFNKHTKLYIYALFNKKKNPQSMQIIFNRISAKILKQKQKPVALVVPYRK